MSLSDLTEPMALISSSRSAMIAPQPDISAWKSGSVLQGNRLHRCWRLASSATRTKKKALKAMHYKDSPADASVSFSRFFARQRNRWVGRAVECTSLEAVASAYIALIYKKFFASFPQLAEIISATPRGCGRLLEAWQSGLMLGS